MKCSITLDLSEKGAVSPFKGKTYDEIHGLEKSIELKEKRRNH
jgi:hypothetical protein